MAEQPLFLGCSFLILGIIITIIGVIQLRLPLQSIHWPAADGEIIEIQSSHTASPITQYRYFVQGKSYTGTRISFQSQGQLPAQLGTAKNTNKQFSKGAHVKVYFDPANPDRSVLLPGVDLSAYLVIASGGFLFVIGLIVSLFSLT